MRKLFFIVLLGAAMGCQPAAEKEPAATKPQVFRGLYVNGPEVSSLYDCESGSSYWVEGFGKKLSELYAQTLLQPAWPYEPIYLVVEGTLGDNVNTYAANYKGTINVTKIDSVASLNFSNNCQQFDFIGGGNEPFWSLFISAQQQVIALKRLDTEVAEVFSYSVPVKNGDITRYTATADGQKIEITIKKEQTGDGMSDLTYPYSLEVKHRGATLKGVALAQGDSPK